MKILVTGSAGFIGFHLAKHFAEMGSQVVGLDNINNYYNVELKYARLSATGIDQWNIKTKQPIQSSVYPNYQFIKADIQDQAFINELFMTEKFDIVCHLAAQAGVRHSIDVPHDYVDSNISGFLNILEACRKYPVKHLIYASSSSIYGLNQKVPFSETDPVQSPVSLYAVSKRANELMAHAYSHLFAIPNTGVRFFTVYGPWGRPDMAPYLFMNAIINHVPIKVFNHGQLSRDFTYIDDIIKGLVSIIDRVPTETPPCKIYNIGAGQPIKLMDFITTIENVTGEKAIKIMTEMQNGDVFHTYADTSLLEKELKFKPQTTIHEGITKFYNWYLSYNSQKRKSA